MPASSGTNQKQRDHQFDTIKGIMIFCVVLGHLLPRVSQFNSAPVAKCLYYAINCFHMPTFVFIAAYFSKHPENDSSHLKKAVASCLLPYLIFDGLYAVLRTKWINGIFLIMLPEWTMWFLLSLFFWKVLIDYLMQFRWPLFIAVLSALFIGFTDASYFLSISRTFCFLPYFVAGYLLSSEKIEWLRHRNKLLAIVAFLIGIAFSQILAYKNIDIDVFQCAHPYVELGFREAWGMLLRFGALLAGFACIFAFLALIPGKKNLLSCLGRNSLWVYLFHSGTIILLQRLHIVEPRPRAAIPYALCLSVLICVIYGNAYFAKAANTFMRSIQKILLKK